MNKMQKIFVAGCSIVILAVVIMVVLVLVNSRKPKELVCTSADNNITIFYNNEVIMGYSSKGYDYDLLSEKNRVDEMGIDKYIEEFSNTYTTNTLGTCKK